MSRIYRTLTISDYDITAEGEVINKLTGKRLKGQLNGKGYLRVGIGKKLLFIHRLVAEKYIPNPKGKPQVNHKDGDKTNNRASNLEWVTNKENREHAVKNNLYKKGENCTWHKLTQNDVLYIRQNYPKIKRNELAKRLNVSPNTISDVFYHRTWKDS